MSFLNSVLSKITGDEQGNGPPTPAPYVPRRKSTTDSLATRNERPRTKVEPAQVLNRKRKAEDGLEKNDQATSRLLEHAPKSLTKNTPIPKPSLPKPSTMASTHPTRVFASTKATASQQEPKKGSFKEIMNRAQAQKNNAKALQIGVVQHKKIEPKSRKEKRDLALSRLPGRKIKSVQTASRRSGSLERKTAKPLDKSQSTKGRSLASNRSIQSVETPTRTDQPKNAYKGTARPNTKPVYSGTARAGRDRLGAAPSSTQPRRGTASTQGRLVSGDQHSSEDDDQGDQEEEEDYGSDISSDMEATGADVEEEEIFSAELARREDNEAMKEETELKRQKEMKKRRWLEQSTKR
ncbi:MAG: hypothetical protein M1814_000508 [Vezdaea aestivalis]|nr:MAG: hypothetical protein M1814_000508 [Vezdaea aestivalis]